MTDPAQTLLSPEFVLLCLAVAIVVQFAKSGFGLRWPHKRDAAGWKWVFEGLPLLIGAGIGWASTFDLDGAIFGLVAGGLSSKVYGLVKPALPAAVQGRAP